MLQLPKLILLNYKLRCKEFNDRDWMFYFGQVFFLIGILSTEVWYFSPK